MSDSSRKRLFVAFEVPAEQRAEAARRAEALRSTLPPARWLRVEAMHVTLVFLGHVSTADCAPLVEALGSAAGSEPARQLTLHGLGCFPPGRRARVLWVGADCVPAADSLRRGLAAAASSEGVTVSAEPYLPHLTLARCPSPWTTRAAEKLAPAFVEPLGEPFVARDVVVFESHLEGRGARHVPYARLPLAEAAEVR